MVEQQMSLAENCLVFLGPNWLRLAFSRDAIIGTRKNMNSGLRQ